MENSLRQCRCLGESLQGPRHHLPIKRVWQVYGNAQHIETVSYTEVHWLSWGAGLCCCAMGMGGLRCQIIVFMKKKGAEVLEFADPIWMCDSEYLVDIMEQLNLLNVQQEQLMNVLQNSSLSPISTQSVQQCGRHNWGMGTDCTSQHSSKTNFIICLPTQSPPLSDLIFLTSNCRLARIVILSLVKIIPCGRVN